MAWDPFAASVAYQSGEPKGVQAVRETLALLEDAAQPSLDPARAEHALAELHAHERLEVGPGGVCTLVPRPRRKVSACHTAMTQVVRGSGRAVLGVQVPLDGAEEQVRAEWVHEQGG